MKLAEKSILAAKERKERKKSFHWGDWSVRNFGGASVLANRLVSSLAPPNYFSAPFAPFCG
jgi:hypothetical protein